eukprot:CCRYP_010897-RA/>CCRYP_010897-RA protein AED:0.45 eAED:0.45 QI:0/0/0/1/0/0/2/0/141
MIPWATLSPLLDSRFIKPSEFSELGHMDQRRAGISSTKSSLAIPPTPDTTTVPHQPDTMELHEQAPKCDKTNMVFMTITKVDSQLFTDQTGPFPITSNQGNNYIVIFYVVDANYIKSYPIKSCHRAELAKAYTDISKFLRT